MTGSAGPSNVMPSTTKKRTRRSLNCEPCRLHKVHFPNRVLRDSQASSTRNSFFHTSKLKCNRARPCSGCVQRGTQNMCFPNYAAEPRKRKASGSSSSQHGSLRGVSSSSAAPLDPLAELNAIQSSLSTLQRHYRTMKKHAHDNVSAPDSALYQDALLGSDTLEAFFIGPTHSCTNLYNYFDVSAHLPHILALLTIGNRLVLSCQFSSTFRSILVHRPRSQENGSKQGSHSIATAVSLKPHQVRNRRHDQLCVESKPFKH